VSLYQPKLLIGLSCAAADGSKDHLDGKEWEDIKTTLRAALEMGIGGRTCVGYGSSGALKGDLLFECLLEGQGPAPKLLNGAAEFRPNMFRAAIRGMALRLFGGVTDARTARQVVGRLFGSISPDDDKDVNVGLLATAYTDASWELGSFGWPKYRQPTYATSGRLQWRLTRSCAKVEHQALLAELLSALHGLTMSLGGFGRGWRRPDHRIFYQGYDKTPIGCHWQWRDASSLPPFIHVQSQDDLARLLQTSQRLARRWLDATRQATGDPAPWRELIHPTQMNIWTRQATDPKDAEAVAWFHREMGGDRGRREMADDRGGSKPNDPCNLKTSDLAGRMNQVGLIWNRLLPLLGSGQAPSSPKAAQPASPLARPANPTARPANPLARPPGVTRGRPAAGRQPAGQSQGDVSIAAHQGAYLEVLVLHPLPPDGARAEAKQHHQDFIDEMNRGAGASFHPLPWTQPR
jgi:CRISPR-associated protein Cmr6